MASRGRKGQDKKQLREAVKRILEKKGIKYNEWKDNEINQRKLAIISDSDKEWTDRTIEEASINLIMDEIVSENKVQNSY